MINVFTIGVYGLTEDEYFNKLLKANIDTFCDVRQRRGVRGAEYAFVNSKRLQSKLAMLGISYFHLKELAPSKEIRKKQQETDKYLKEKKRRRIELSNEFKEAYRLECLEKFELTKFLETLGSKAKNIVLFCVESKPEACHRSLISDFLGENIKDVHVEHL